MANFHSTTKIITRSNGRSAVGSAAYRAAEKIKNEHDGLVHDYTRKRGVVYSEILLPEHAPEAYKDRNILWNAVEKIEKSKNAQTAREVEISLPVELTTDNQLSMLLEYAQKQFVDKGMCADVCLHDKRDSNPHAHIMLTMRPFNEDGSWGAKSQKVYVLDEDGNKIYDRVKKTYKCTTVKTTNWDDKDNVNLWREQWANICNRELERIGSDARVDYRSYEEQGVARIPTKHLGPYASALEKRNIPTEMGNVNRQIQETNKQIENIENEIEQTKNRVENLQSYRERLTALKENVDSVINGCDSFTDFLQKIKSLGYRVKQGKYLAICPPGQESGKERFIRLKSLGEQYTEENIIMRIAQKAVIDDDPVFAQVNKYIVSHKPQEVKLLIDIKNKVKYQQSPGLANWAKLDNLKRSVDTLNYLTSIGVGSYEQLQHKTESSNVRYQQVSETLKKIENRLRTLGDQIQQTTVYRQTLPVSKQYRSLKQGRAKDDFYRKHETELILYKAARKELDAYRVDGVLPSLNVLQEEQKRLKTRQGYAYKEYCLLRDEIKQLYVINNNVNKLLDIGVNKKKEVRTHNNSL